MRFEVSLRPAAAGVIQLALLLLLASPLPAQLGGVEMGGKGGGLPGGGSGQDPGDTGSGGSALAGEALARHVLDRISFGADDRELALLRRMGVDGYILYQLRPEAIPEDPQLLDSLAAMPPRYTVVGDPLMDQNQLYADTFLRAVYSRRQLRELMTEFWRNHFATGDQVGGGGFVGFYSSLAIEPATGNPTIAYYDQTRDRPRVSRWTGSSWAQLDVDPQRGNGEYTSLAYDPVSGQPAVSYYSRRDGSLRLSRWDGGQWLVETVNDGGDVASDVGLWTSLDFDSQGQAHIVYQDASNGDLLHSQWDAASAGWLDAVVDASGEVGAYASLVIDASDALHVAYYDAGNGDLKYAYNDGSGWSSELVEATGDVGQYASLAVDPADGEPAIAYYDAGNADLRLARPRPGSGWSSELVDAAGDVGQHASLAFAGPGEPAIAYHQVENYDLKLARWDPLASGWSFELPRPDAQITGLWNSLVFAIDPVSQQQVPAISYYDGSRFYLRYTLLSDGRWVVTTADNRGNTRFRNAVWAQEELDGFREHALGKFRDLLEVSATSAMMMVFLNNDENTASRGNENYARELLELHTMGVDNGYTQLDVEEAARVLTGWTVKAGNRSCEWELPADPPRDFCYNHEAHDPYLKTVLGQSYGSMDGVQTADEGRAEGEALLDYLSRHASTAQFVCGKLIEKLVGDDPPARLHDACAEEFLASDGNIRRVLWTLLSSPEFRSERYALNKVRTPYEYVVAALRNLGGETDGASLWDWMEAQGMDIFRFNVPTGFSEQGSDWVSSNSFLQRWKYAEALAHSSNAGRYAVSPYELVAESGLGDARAILEYLLARLVRLPLADAERALLLEVLEPSDGPPFDMADRGTAEQRLRDVTGLILALPGYMKQ